MKTVDITIELSNICNYSCDMCFLREKDVISGQFIRKENIVRFISQLEESDYRVHVLRTFWAGEGMLHPDFCEIIEMLSHCSKIDIISFDSNASMLDNDIAEFLINISEKKDIRIIFSVDSSRKDIYSNIRKGGDLDKVNSNIRNMLSILRKRKHSKMKIMIQFIIHPDNSHILGEFIDMWKNEFSGLDFNIYLNQSMAIGNGINIRPLTIQDERQGITQDRANALFVETLRENGILRQDQDIEQFSQGGGHIMIKEVSYGK